MSFKGESFLNLDQVDESPRQEQWPTLTGETLELMDLYRELLLPRQCHNCAGYRDSPPDEENTDDDEVSASSASSAEKSSESDLEETETGKDSAAQRPKGRRLAYLNALFHKVAVFEVLYGPDLATTCLLLHLFTDFTHLRFLKLKRFFSFTLNLFYAPSSLLPAISGDRSFQDQFSHYFTQTIEQILSLQEDGHSLAQLYLNFTIVLTVLHQNGFLFPSSLGEKLLPVLLAILNRSTDLRVKLQAILVIEMTLLRQRFDQQKVAQTIAAIPENIPLFLSEGSPKIDTLPYQLTICSAWLTSQQEFLASKVSSPIDEATYLTKVSPLGPSVRVDHLKGASFRALAQVSSGTVTYEAVLCTAGRFQIGWATAERAYTVGVEANTEKDRERSPERKYDPFEQVEVGDLIRVCLVLEERQREVSFTCNGTFLQVQQVEPEPEQSAMYFPFIRILPLIKKLSALSGQQVTLNFSQAHLDRPHLDGSASETRVQMVPIDATDTPLRWKPDLERKCTEYLDLILQSIESDSSTVGPMLWKAVPETFGLATFFISMMESSRTLSNGKVSIWAGLVNGLICQFSVDEFTDLTVLLNGFLRGKWSNTGNTRVQHRHFCIFMANLVMTNRVTHGLLENFFLTTLYSEQLFAYLLDRSFHSPDKYCQLYALLALKEWNYTSEQRETLLSDPVARSLFRKSEHRLNQPNYRDLTANIDNLLVNYQIYTLAYDLEQKCINPERKPERQHPKQNLRPPDDPQCYTLSPDRLSLRCDFSEKSVSTVCPSEPGCSVFYEVVLLTSGQLTVGWATGKSALLLDTFTQDEYSIGFNGYEGAVQHDGQLLEPLGGAPMWKVGDVVGCLLQRVPGPASEGRFRFFHNGTEIQYQTDGVFFSAEPYYATVRLTAHQQVYFNLGQFPFKHPPRRTDFTDLWTLAGKAIKRERGGGNQTEVNLKGAILENVCLNVNATNTVERMSFNSRKKPRT